jgi:hypothetical protein
VQGIGNTRAGKLNLSDICIRSPIIEIRKTTDGSSGGVNEGMTGDMAG